jgi:CTP-dependent riboflavin kinase
MIQHDAQRLIADTAGLVVTGSLASGLGEGAYFTKLDWVVRGFEEKLGFRPYPGTFNLTMAGAAWQQIRVELVRAAGIALPPHPGNCGAKCFRLLVEERHAGVLIIPDVADYPEDKFEIVAPVELRPRLAVVDGEKVRVRLLPE